MDIDGLKIFYGKVVHAETNSYTSGFVADGSGGVDTQVVRTLYLMFDGGEELPYTVNAAFPARKGNLVGVVFGKPSVLGFGKEACLGLVNSTTGNYWVFSRNWRIYALIPLVLAFGFLFLKIPLVLEMWDAGNHLGFLFALLPVHLFQYPGIGFSDRMFWSFILLSSYPLYRCWVWQRITQFVSQAART